MGALQAAEQKQSKWPPFFGEMKATGSQMPPKAACAWEAREITEGKAT